MLNQNVAPVTERPYRAKKQKVCEIENVLFDFYVIGQTTLAFQYDVVGNEVIDSSD